MKIRIILLSLAAVFFTTGCASKNVHQPTKILGSSSIKADALATYYNDAVYFTKQQHFYDVNNLKMKVKANEPTGAYEMSYSGTDVSLSNDAAVKFWNAQMARLLTYGFTLSGKYATPESLKFIKSDSIVRIRGILYNVYNKADMTLFARVSDGTVDRLQTIGSDGVILSAFCYNSFYQARLDRVVAHNIDIYTGNAAGVDTKLIYGVKYTGF